MILKENKNVFILCAGWKNKFSLEDTLYAGALAEKLMESEKYDTICDSTQASMDLWSIAKNDLMVYIEKCAHKHRLKKIGLDNVIPYCFNIDTINSIPVYKDGIIKKM
jgi:2-phosphosulfolactate phosphatase